MVEKLLSLIDLDGTLADYDSAMVRDMELIRSPNEVMDLTPHVSKVPHMKARAKMIRSQPNWWFDLLPLKAGFEIIDMLKKYNFDIHILTKAPHSVDEAWTDKIRWCKKYLPGIDVTITKHKELVNGAILVDDWVPYVDGWLKHRLDGLVILPIQRWNEYYTHKQAIHYNGTNMEEVENRVKLFLLKRG